MRNEYSIQFLCSLMGVNRSGYYKWRKRQGKINQYGQKRQQLVSLLKAQHNRFPSYGYHRLAAVIRNETDLLFSDNLVHKCCRQCSIRSKIHHYKYKKTGRENTFYPNTVAGKWNAKRPLELVVSDMTILKHKGKLHEWVYVLDTFNNEIISHHLGRRHGDPRPYYQCLEDLKQKKDEQSMGDYAASGGYYISCVADTIVAEPTTLTGSIGIFGMVPNVKELSEKIGLTYDVVKTNKFSDFGNIMRPFNQDEKTLMQMMITQGYDTFVNRCAEGRHMSKEAIEKIAEGRVWTGEAAKELGLVDVLGGIDTALEIAVRKAGIEGYTVVSYPAKQDLLSSLLNTKPTNYVESQILKSKLGEYYQQFGMLKNLKERSMIQARIPFELNIK